MSGNDDRRLTAVTFHRGEQLLSRVELPAERPHRVTFDVPPEWTERFEDVTTVVPLEAAVYELPGRYWISRARGIEHLTGM